MLAAEIDTVIPNLATGYLGDDEQGFRRAAHAYPQGGEGGLTSTVEDLLIWSRHFDEPTLGKTIPTQLAAAAPLTGGHANRYRRGVARRRAARPRHDRPWRPVAGLSAPSSCACRRPELTVVVIANLGSIDPWRLAHAIAHAGAGRRQADEARAARRSAQAEIKPIAGTWFNAEEPSLFELAWTQRRGRR